MTYAFKINGIYPVTAQTAGEELQRIYARRGSLRPADIVDESRSEDAPLHPCFEWDDAKAAEKYREGQAYKLVQAITTVMETDSGPSPVRAFVHVEKDYHPIQVVLSSEERTRELLQTALRELISFKAKYNTLSALRRVFAEIDQLTLGDLAETA